MERLNKNNRSSWSNNSFKLYEDFRKQSRIFINSFKGGDRLQMINISSGNIVSIGYDKSRKVMRIKLKNSIYKYNRGPEYIFRDFFNDSNKVKFYNSRIRHFYSAYKVR